MVPTQTHSLSAVKLAAFQPSPKLQIIALVIVLLWALGVVLWACIASSRRVG